MGVISTAVASGSDGDAPTGALMTSGLRVHGKVVRKDMVDSMLCGLVTDTGCEGYNIYVVSIGSNPSSMRFAPLRRAMVRVVLTRGLRRVRACG